MRPTEERISSFLSCERPYLVKNGFRAIHHVEKDQATTQRKTVPFLYLEREVLLMMLRTAVRSAMTGSNRIGLCVPGPSGVHILAEFPVA